MIVFNPDSGPGAAADQAYATVIAQAQAAGITMLGYVATSYGARPEAEVIADINRYYDYYALSGIYFAEGPMENDCTPMEAMYHRMSDAVRARDPQAYLSVGTRFCPTYITFFDMMVQFARNWSEYQTDYAPPSWMPANSPQRFAHFVNNVPASDASPRRCRGRSRTAPAGCSSPIRATRTRGACCPAISTKSWPRCAACSDGRAGGGRLRRAVVVACRDAPIDRDARAGSVMSRPSETALLTVLALVAFASNSILTRLALGAGAMDAATFTTVRLLAGAGVLAAIVRAQGGPSPVGRGGGRGLIGPVALFAYAAPFTFAYVRIGAATGALLLFGAVQITMIGWGSPWASGRVRGRGSASPPPPRAWYG